MNKIYIVLASFAFLSTSISMSTAAAEELISPLQLVRAVILLQDRYARGDLTSRASLQLLLAQVGHRFEVIDRSMWKDKGNLLAASAFLFNGGSPSIIRRLIARGAIQASNEPVLEGALAFAEGRFDDARQLLLNSDPAEADPVISAALAFVRGTLEVGYNIDQANKHFNLARLLAPGSAIEESAIRRQALLSADASQFREFSEFVRQHFRKYPTSPYAEKFRQEVLSITPRAIESNDAGLVGFILQMMDEFPDRDRGAAELKISTELILRGKIDVASILTARSQNLEQNNSNLPKLGKTLRTLGESTISIVDVEKLPAFDLGSLDADYAILSVLSKAIARLQAQYLNGTDLPNAGMTEGKTPLPLSKSKIAEDIGMRLRVSDELVSKE